MKLVIERDALLKALARVHGVVNAKHTIPILSNVRLDAGSVSLCLTANNLDQQSADSLSAQVEAPGSVTVEAKRLLDAVRAFPSGGQVKLSLAEGDGRLVVQCGRSRCLYPTLPAGDFPQFPSLKTGKGGEIDRSDLLRLLKRTRFAASTDETRYMLNGLHLHVRHDEAGALRLTAAATDGKTMAVCDMLAPAGFEEFPTITLPAVAVDELKRLISDGEGPVELVATRELVELRCGSAELTSKLIDGVYPDYRKVIPATSPFEAVIDVDLLQACVNRALLVCEDKDRTVRLAFSGDTLALSARGSDGASQVNDEIGIRYVGADCDLGFNAKRLKDVLGKINGENATFALAPVEQALPALITDSADQDVQYVLVLHRA